MLHLVYKMLITEGELESCTSFSAGCAVRIDCWELTVLAKHVGDLL